MKRILNGLKSERGASLVEYALVAVLIALPSVVALQEIADTMNDDFDKIEGASAEEPLEFSTTSTAPTTSHPSGTPTTSTTAPPASSTTAPTSTTAPPGGGEGETPVDPAPNYQTETVDTDGGWFTFELDNGQITIDAYDLNYNWRGSYQVNADGTYMTVWLCHRRDGSAVTITTWVDEDGYLQTNVE